MDEYPDPDDEYDLMYGDELEVMREFDDNNIEPPDLIPKKSKQSLNFDEPDPEIECINKASKRTSDTVNELLPPAKRRKTPSPIVVGNDLGVEILDIPFENVIQRDENISKYLCGVTSLSFPTWNFLTINTEFGERLYVKLKPPNDEIVNDIVQESNKSVSNHFRNLKAKVLMDMEYEKEKVVEHKLENDVQVITETSDLWVEQFKPKRYLELLSDEGVNRALLSWIKTWDKTVFNKERVVKEPPSKPIIQKKQQFKGKQQLQEEKASELGEDGRPHHKIALLCGPPGIGKTTLAHVIASLAGYNVVEVNASDERSVESFRNTLQNATEMQSVMGSKKPNCLILDEIDGAPAPSIDFLLKFVNGKVVEKAKKSKKGKEEKTKVMKRPVICICNEPYTPALRQLRQQAYVLHFPHTSATKLAQRLLEICKRQGMKTDLSTLALLCDKAHSDIRSCITTLHFFKTRNGKAFKAIDVTRTSVGLKDMQKSLFNVWQEVFQKPTKKNSVVGSTLVESDNYCAYHPDNMKRLKNIVKILCSAGDYDKLGQGVHENMLKVHYPRFQASFLKGSEWFCWTDLLDTSIRHDQNFILLPYLPYAFAGWHFLYSTPAWPKITYPSVGYENHVKLTKNTQILTDVLRGLSPRLRAYTQRSNLLLDVLPLLPRILAPSIRPVNATLFTDREKADLRNLVDVMMDFNFNYLQQRAPDGTYYYAFDPSFEEVVLFPIKERARMHELSYNLKQMVSREVELERMRKADHSLHKSTAKDGSAEATKPKTPVKEPQKPKINVPVLPTDTVQYKDFFGRIVQVQRSECAKFGGDKNSYLKSPIWYSFKEGFNNAVKKDVTMADLL